MSHFDEPRRTHAVKGLAALAVTTAEMGGDHRVIIAAVAPYTEYFGLTSAQDVRDIAAAVPRPPQPEHDSGGRREDLRFSAQMRRINGSEEHLTAALVAREALHAFASEIERQG
ncbi:hypothetical protein [Auraticoccus monumenti]|uniref:Uncharacterized protein n=1 Tax=Auraticoccus monumenti TaxID=675864 RepID=A0A1G6W3F0_9ACTN|nr:hypothetical protein [Auraticoccus monumenti]SDD60371.1 hypothetical protein SAMN04489747_1335 [Auraticoccus monumenti]